jgi:hypothetical protein
MPDQTRQILLAAIRAARYGSPPEASLLQAISEGDRELTLEQLEFDSLAWMEFCISVELQSGQELTTSDVEQMRYVFQIEEWLRARAEHA